MAIPEYEVIAIKYAQREGRRAEHFIGGDPHDAPMAMDYFVWLIRGAQGSILVDTGFTAEVAAKRRREYLRRPKDALALLGVPCDEIRQVIITHMHYDHVGTFFDFPQAVFNVQDEEMKFVSGRHMCHERFARSFEIEDVAGMIRLLFQDRVRFHQGTAALAPGISLHHIGGHTPGLQVVRVRTRRGWVVLASDGSHYYEHMQTGRCFPTMFNLGDALEGYGTLRRLAESPQHVIPGHDPLVMARYPAVSPQLEGVAARLDVMPRE